MIFYDTISWFVISKQTSHTTFPMLMTKKVIFFKFKFSIAFCEKETNKGRTYDSAIELRHYILCDNIFCVIWAANIIVLARKAAQSVESFYPALFV